MPSMVKGSFIRFLRERKKWTQADLNEQSGFKEFNLSRLETNRHNPNEDTFSSLLYSLGSVSDTFFCFIFENPNAKAFGLKDRLTHELFWCEHYIERQKTVKGLIDEISNMDGFHKGINKQYVLSCKARYGMILYDNPHTILDITNEGIQLTYENYIPNDIRGDVLLFEEPQLIHTQALAHGRIGDIDRALQQLYQLKEGLVRLPRDDRAKERFLTPIILDLAKLLTQKGDYDTALELFEEGNALSVKRNRGKYTPDFLYNKAIALYSKGKEKECTDLLTPVYHGFIAKRLPGRAKEVLDFANKIGYEIKTYGVENIPLYVPELSVEYGDSKPCNTFGGFIRSIRKIADMTAYELCEGLCDPSVLYKIENNDTIGITGNVYLLEAFMQRLGRYIDSYFDTFMSLKDFEQKQLRNEINSCLTHRKYDEAEKLLVMLNEKSEFKKHRVNKQYIKLAETLLYNKKQDKDDAKNMEMLLETLHMTKPHFDESKIAKARLSSNEIIILNQMANLICAKGDLPRGTLIFKNLLAAMNTFISDEPERMRLYPMVLSNYTKFLGLKGNHHEALQLAIAGDDMCAKYCNLSGVSNFAATRGWNLCELGRVEESIPLLAQSFYTSGLVGKTGNQKAAKKYAEEKLNLKFV